MAAPATTTDGIWDRCEAVWRHPRRLHGAYAFTGTRVPLEALFNNINDGASIDEFLEWYPGVERSQVEEVLEVQQARIEQALSG